METTRNESILILNKGSLFGPLFFAVYPGLDGKTAIFQLDELLFAIKIPV